METYTNLVFMILKKCGQYLINILTFITLPKTINQNFVYI
jgi:hypothetical protein